MAASSTTIDLGKLDAIRQQLLKGYYAKVGILSDKPHDGTDFGMVELGTIHEFGSITNNIPPRSFLRMPLLEKKKDLVNVLATRTVATMLENGNIKDIFKVLGVKAQAIIQDAFATGGFGKWKDINPATKKAKGSSAILIDTGELRRSISSAVVKGNEKS